MKKGYVIIFLLLQLLICSKSLFGQESESYLKTNAILVENPEKLNNSIYKALSPYDVIMFGEMHGTNESAPFVKGLITSLTNHGDSVLLGLEIPNNLMNKYNELHTDSSIFHSDFFSKPPYYTGKESVAWATLTLEAHKNPKVKVFFFDVNLGEGKGYERDSLMASKVGTEVSKHNNWRVITLSGNYHNKITNPASMYSALRRNSKPKICSLNIEYKEGSASADFGKGLEVKRLGSYPSILNSTEGYENYFLMYLPNANHDYHGIYYIKIITPAKMWNNQ